MSPASSRPRILFPLCDSWTPLVASRPGNPVWPGILGRFLLLSPVFGEAFISLQCPVGSSPSALNQRGSDRALIGLVERAEGAARLCFRAWLHPGEQIMGWRRDMVCRLRPLSIHSLLRYTAGSFKTFVPTFSSGIAVVAGVCLQILCNSFAWKTLDKIVFTPATMWQALKYVG